MHFVDEHYEEFLYTIMKKQSLNPSVTLGFKFQILPRTGRVLDLEQGYP
jgi:hypothetical protein